MKQPTIIDAIKSRQLFGSLPRFKKIETWTAWIVALKALFGLSMSSAEVNIFEKCTARKTPPKRGVKECYFSLVDAVENLSSRL